MRAFCVLKSTHLPPLPHTFQPPQVASDNFAMEIIPKPAIQSPQFRSPKVWAHKNGRIAPRKLCSVVGCSIYARSIRLINTKSIARQKHELEERVNRANKTWYINNCVVMVHITQPWLRSDDELNRIRTISNYVSALAAVCVNAEYRNEGNGAKRARMREGVGVISIVFSEKWREEETP